MYCFRESASGGEFVSAITHKTYAFKPTRDNSDKKRAKHEMEEDHRQVRAALTERLGREPSTKEMRNGIQPGDTRPLRERIAQDGSVTSNPPRSPEENPFQDRLVDLQNRRPLTREDRSKLNRRIEQLETASARFQKEQEAVKAENDAMKRIESDVLDARTSVTLAKFGTGFDSEDVRVAQKLLHDLEVTKDVEAYRAARDEWEAEVKARRNATAAQLEQDAQKQRELAALIRSGEASGEASSEAKETQ